MAIVFDKLIGIASVFYGPRLTTQLRSCPLASDGLTILRRTHPSASILTVGTEALSHFLIGIPRDLRGNSDVSLLERNSQISYLSGSLRDMAYPNKRCWEIVGRDVILAVHDFFHSGVVTPGLNFNFIVFLSTMRDSITIDQFHPIVLGNFLFKVSSKILPDRGTIRNLRRVVHAFKVYASISGQLFNWSKSFIFFGSSISLARISSLQSLVWMQIGRLPFSYLGVPLFRGKPRKSILMPIADKILSKFAKWKDLALLNDSLLQKLTWKFITLNSFAFLFYARGILGSCKNRMEVTSPFPSGILLGLTMWRVSDFIRDGRWILDDRFRALFPDLCFRIGRIAISLVIDYLVWHHSREGRQCLFLSVIRVRSALSLMLHSIYVANRLGIGCMRKCVDDLLILHLFGLSSRLGKAPVIRSVVWSPPALGWIKLLSIRSDQVTWRVRQTWQRCIHQISNMEFQVSYIFREVSSEGGFAERPLETYPVETAEKDFAGSYEGKFTETFPAETSGKDLAGGETKRCPVEPIGGFSKGNSAGG
ncbi:hypothetical protein Dsin_024538 [Dipteronia sinensis]|uniref:Uncharacterized protein n=1 Tax=Dipteronia sinensis TaxID=43782 RepID=A0AAD9ZVN5_9ROSI|nr:hypothetical protein Dsin_024538 [Dipteronia sinensis]